jgi:hypothetical protein
MEIVKSKLVRVCDAFAADKFQMPTTTQEFAVKLRDLERNLADVQNVRKFFI